jgi:hypothetical protein
MSQMIFAQLPLLFCCEFAGNEKRNVYGDFLTIPAACPGVIAATAIRLDTATANPVDVPAYDFTNYLLADNATAEALERALAAPGETGTLTRVD